ncbi:MAG: hypothetical protein Q4G43_12705 [Mobilicoccus sp.]|nr:hypothetical protein [Mobilicoccus sp.]
MSSRRKKPDADEFARALRAAIADSGMSLDQVRRALSRHGVRVSVATLSYWQSGRSRPERATSLAAIGPLEECLRLPRGRLAACLPTRVQETRATTAAPRGSWPRTHIDQAVERLGLSYDDFAWLSIHDLVKVSVDRVETSREVRVLIAATRDGVDRYPVWVTSDDATEVPSLSAVTNCRLGRVQTVPAHAGVAAEMLLPRPLLRGESMIAEHRITYGNSSAPRNRVGRRITHPFREISLQVHFDSAAVPTSCRRVSVVKGVRTEAPVPAHATAQALFIDGQPGLYELEWTW